MIEVTYFHLTPHTSIDTGSGSTRFTDLSELIVWINLNADHTIVTLITHIKHLAQ